VINRLPFVVVEWPRSTQDLVRISIDRVETNFVIDIRSWGRDSNGVLKPGPQGLMLSVRHLPKLVSGFDRPPLKWSTLSYGFLEEDRDAEEDLQAGRDCRQAAPG
jgi:hypothetical protein